MKKFIIALFLCLFTTSLFAIDEVKFRDNHPKHQHKQHEKKPHEHKLKDKLKERREKHNK